MIMHSTPKQHGFTLVELLVALALGLFLTAAVVQSYVSTKETSRITESVNRVQENSRFAYHILTRDLRETSSLGCLRSIRDMSPSTNQLNDLRVKVGGWDHDDTSPGDEITLSDAYAISTTRNKWSGINTGAGSNLPSNIDSITLSDTILIKEVTKLRGAVVSLTVSNKASVNIANYTPAVNETLIVGDCQKADKFEVASVTTTGSVSEVTPKGSFGFIKNWGDSASVYAVSYVNYYIGYRTGAETPSLYRLSSAPGSAAEELVEGVENLQLLYGVDLSGDGFANRYVSASSVTDWTDIVSVRAGFLYVAPNSKDPQSAATAETYTVADGINFKAAANDRNLRYTSTMTIKTRNLGLTEDFDVCFAASADPAEAICNIEGYVVRTP